MGFTRFQTGEDVKEISNTYLTVFYSLFIFVYVSWIVRNLVSEGGFYLLTYEVINLVSAFVSISLLIVPAWFVVTKVPEYQNQTLILSLLLAGTFLVGILLFSAGGIFKLFIGSRIMVYLFGRSKWDDELVEKMAEDGIVEDVKIDSQGVNVTVNNEKVKLDEYTVNSSIIKYNTKIKYL